LEIETPQLRSAERRRLFDNIGSLYLLQGLNYVIPMAVLPYLVRTLGMEEYGLVAFAQSFAQYFNILTDYGFNFSATRSIAQNRDDAEKISEIFCSVFLIKISLTVIGLIALLLLLILVPRMRHDWTIYMFAFVAVIGNVIFPVWLFQGIEKMRYISVISGTTKIISALLLFIYVHGPADGLLAVAIQSAGMVLAGVIGIVVCLRTIHLDLQWPSRESLKTCSVDGWHLFVSTASVSLYTNSNVFLVGLLAGNIQAGYFSAAEKLIRAISGLIGPINQSAFPYINSLARTSSQAALSFIAHCLKWMSALTLAPVIILFFLAPQVAVMFFGHTALGAVPIMRWIAPLPFLIAVSNVLGIQTMLVFGLDKQFSRILISAGIVNILLGAPLIIWLGAIGAGISVLVTETLVTSAMVVVLRNHRIIIPLGLKTAV
jgi:polysaccharide transporter, PST family